LQTRIDTELRILGEHPHPHVVGLVEVIDDPSIDTLYVILEGMRGGQLMEWSDDHGGYGARSEPSEVERLWGERVRLGAPEAGVLVYQEAVASALLGQLLAAVAHLHERGIIHKDLKPDNVLLSMPVPTADPRFVRPMPPCEAAEGAKGPADPAADGGLRELVRQSGFVAKVGDFNTAVECALPHCHIWDAEGTQQFAPPECFDPQRDGGILGQQRDVWSVGCVLFAMLFGRCPFWHEEPIRLQLALIEFAMDKAATVDVPDGAVSPQAEDLIRQLLCKDPASRPLATAALQHPWVQ
jgi:[calcium/calmodulin-dependent protein kinase] kinase